MPKIDGYKFWQEKLNASRFILAPMVEQVTKFKIFANIFQ